MPQLADRPRASAHASCSPSRPPKLGLPTTPHLPRPLVHQHFEMLLVGAVLEDQPPFLERAVDDDLHFVQVERLGHVVAGALADGVLGEGGAVKLGAGNGEEDEPLAHLEDQVRLRLRAEIVRLHHDRGLTSLLATASQHDAMAMCDRIAVLFGGVVSIAFWIPRLLNKNRLKEIFGSRYPIVYIVYFANGPLLFLFGLLLLIRFGALQ